MAARWGISTPLIAHWPKGIPTSRTGAWESQPGHLIDLMATVADVGSATYPGGESQAPGGGQPASRIFR